jgi:hypothetical protein
MDRSGLLVRFQRNSDKKCSYNCHSQIHNLDVPYAKVSGPICYVIHVNKLLCETWLERTL